MKYDLVYTSAFKKQYKLLSKRKFDLKLLDEVILTLQKGETLDSKYKDHYLEGTFRKHRECHIKPDWLLIYFIDESTLTLVAEYTGTHSDLFN